MRTIIASLLVLPTLALLPKLHSGGRTWSQAQEAQFRARGEVVSVDVGVFSGSHPVAGLAATDFLLTDNGVPQKLELFSIESVPIDVTLVLDASGSMSDNLKELTNSARRIGSMLGSETRIRMLSFSNTLQQVVDWQSPSAPIDFEHVNTMGAMSPQDALALCLVWGGSGDRRHVVVLLTDGFESDTEMVVIRSGKLLEIAKRFDGVLHVILFERRNHDEFRDVAEATGGQLHRAGSASRIGQTFEQVFQSFRQSYVLRYVPTGVMREGWHEIEVKIARPGGNKYTVRARKGYFVD